MAAKPSKRFYCPHHWTLAQRLDHYTDKSGGPHACWPWTGALAPNGYGRLRLPGERRMIYAHRVAYIVHRGSIPEDMLVCHTCDVRPCGNPDHLFIGTHADNLSDMSNKGRSLIGETNPHSILTADDVRAIRQAAGTQRAIAKRFGVHFQTVNDILRGRNWGRVR